MLSEELYSLASLHHKHTNGVDVSGSRAPPTHHDDRRALRDVAFPTALRHTSEESLLHVFCPVIVLWLLIEKRMDASEQMALQI